MIDRYDLSGKSGGVGKFVMVTEQQGSFMDAVYSFFNQLDRSGALCRLMDSQFYDTDAVEMDIELVDQSNMALALGDDARTDSLQRIRQFVKRYKSQKQSFSV